MWDYALSKVLILSIRVSYGELVHYKKVKTATGCAKSNHHIVYGLSKKTRTRDVLCTGSYSKLYSEPQFLRDRKYSYISVCCGLGVCILYVPGS